MFVFIILSAFISIIGLITYLNNQIRNKQWSGIVDILGNRVIAQLKQVKCEMFTSGGKNGGYCFTRCDLFITEDALVIFGHSQVLMMRQLGIPLVLTNNPSFYTFDPPYPQLVKPKTINLNSFDRDIYIEFELPGFIIQTNVEIRLKEISDDVRKKLEFLKMI